MLWHGRLLATQAVATKNNRRPTATDSDDVADRIDEEESQNVLAVEVRPRDVKVTFHANITNARTANLIDYRIGTSEVRLIQ